MLNKQRNLIGSQFRSLQTVAVLSRSVALAAVVVLISTMGCAPQNKSAESSTLAEAAQVATFDANLYPLNKVVCDPFEGGGAVDVQGGLKTELYYLTPGQSYNHVADYIAHGHRSEQTLFFSQLYVPTRMFSLGFNTETGGQIKDDAGNSLIEYFALKFSSVLKLAADQPEGLYQFSILSDDGAVMRIRDTDGVWKTLVDNDGNHPTRMGCGTTTLEMRHDTERMLEISYYQGPRYHISLIPMFRRVTSAQAALDSSCGTSGNSLFFNPNANSAIQAAYQNLLGRGWQPLNKNNYSLPNTAMFNPCTTTGTPPIISGLHLSEPAATGFTVMWDTDIPSTSQVIYQEVGGAEQITVADNFLVKTHVVVVPGLKANTLYQVKAVSISSDLGKTISTSIDVTTSAQ